MIMTLRIALTFPAFMIPVQYSTFQSVIYS